jgi:hypothetical protein
MAWAGVVKLTAGSRIVKRANYVFPRLHLKYSTEAEHESGRTGKMLALKTKGLAYSPSESQIKMLKMKADPTMLLKTKGSMTKCQANLPKNCATLTPS